MLEIENLKTNFNTYDVTVKALDGVNLKIEDGEIFGLVEKLEVESLLHVILL